MIQAEIVTEPRFYGRRKGHTLRTHKSHLMATLLPTLVLKESETLDFSKETWLEIGFGGGEHLANLAEQYPLIHFIGCEAFENGIASLLQHIEQKSLKNVAIYPKDARLFFKNLPEASLSKAFIMFPDPWPKPKQRKRRLVNQAFLQQLGKALKPGAELRFASDDHNYVKQVHRLILESQNFSTLILKDEKPTDWPLTRYNQKAIQKGITSWYLQAEKDFLSSSSHEK